MFVLSIRRDGPPGDRYLGSGGSYSGPGGGAPLKPGAPGGDSLPGSGGAGAGGPPTFTQDEYNRFEKYIRSVLQYAYTHTGHRREMYPKPNIA